MADKIVKFWRGKRDTYNEIVSAGTVDYWTRYTVIEPDGRRVEYFGTHPVQEPTGELYPVLDAVETLPTDLKPGDRYLVGKDGIGYYVVEIAADLSQSKINPLGKHSVRVAKDHYFRYQCIGEETKDLKLVTYDNGIDCGTY